MPVVISEAAVTTVQPVLLLHHPPAHAGFRHLQTPDSEYQSACLIDCQTGADPGLDSPLSSLQKKAQTRTPADSPDPQLGPYFTGSRQEEEEREHGLLARRLSPHKLQLVLKTRPTQTTGQGSTNALTVQLSQPPELSKDSGVGRLECPLRAGPGKVVGSARRRWPCCVWRVPFPVTRVGAEGVNSCPLGLLSCRIEALVAAATGERRSQLGATKKTTSGHFHKLVF